MFLESVTVFTDGASRGNPGPGGFAAIIVKHDDSQTSADFTQTDAEARHIQVVELGGREERTTNNRMELTAAIKALRQIEDPGLKIAVYTDSSYLVSGITKWVYSWEKRNWVTAQKEAVLNRDLWEKLLTLSRGKRIEWKLIGGHVGIAGNERCDEIATLFADGLPPPLYQGPLEKYPIRNILNLQGRTLETGKGSTLKSRSRKAAYSYVSKVEGIVQTHKTWKECEERVKGKRVAAYRKVFSAEEERRLMREWSGGQPSFNE